MGILYRGYVISGIGCTLRGIYILYYHPRRHRAAVHHTASDDADPHWERHATRDATRRGRDGLIPHPASSRLPPLSTFPLFPLSPPPHTSTHITTTTRGMPVIHHSHPYPHRTQGIPASPPFFTPLHTPCLHFHHTSLTRHPTSPPLPYTTPTPPPPPAT